MAVMVVRYTKFVGTIYLHWTLPNHVADWHCSTPRIPHGHNEGHLITIKFTPTRILGGVRTHIGHLFHPPCRKF
jgi:hypothetical protein